MKIVFFGTPDFAVPTLEILLSNRYEVYAVVTAPDKERGRGRKVTFTPVKEAALKNNIPVLQPEKMNDEKFIEELKKFNADLFIIVAFRILPEEVYTIPKLGSFNLHGSLLPKYRGAAPIQWAIINGDTKTGVTTFFLEKKVDTGNIILKKEIPILPEDDFGSLHDKMCVIGAETILETVKLIESDKAVPQKQNDSEASPAPKITKETCLINWNNPAEKIKNLIRGLSPYPAAYFVNSGKNYKVYKCEISNNKNLKSGEIFQDKNNIIIGTGDKALQILEIQPEGKNRMTAADFLRGNKL